MGQRIKFILNKYFNILLMLTLLSASSCGLKWEELPGGSENIGGGPDGKVSISSGSESKKSLILTSLKFDTPQRALDLRTRGRLNVTANQDENLKGISIQLRHSATGRTILIVNAASLVEVGNISFSISSELGGTKDYDVIQRSLGKTTNETKVSLDADYTINYGIK